MGLIAYPTKYEIYDSESGELMVASLEAFDGDSYTVTANTIMDSNELQELTNIMKRVEELSKGITGV
jgi:histidyl-tRNA synthetase